MDSPIDDVLSYNDICEYLTREIADEDGEKWKFRKILGHQHTPQGHPDRNGSEYNVKIFWETGETTYMPLDQAAKQMPVDLAKYGKANNLLTKNGWKRFKKLARRDKVVDRLVKQAKLRSFRLRPKYKYGYEVPRDYNHAKQLDARNGNNKCEQANKLEHKKLHEYKVFIRMGKYHESKIPRDYQEICVHTIFDVKHDFCHQARVIADGYLTQVLA